MNAYQSHGDQSNEQVSSKRLKSLSEKAPYPTRADAAFDGADAAVLNNLGVDCFEENANHASRCFRSAMRIFAPSLPRGLCREALEPACEPRMTRTVSVDAIDAICVGEQETVDQRRASVASPLSPAAPATEEKKAEYDEGMNTYNRPLRIDLGLQYDYRRTAPVLLFNIGQLYVLGGDDATAANYFLYAIDIINQGSVASFANCIPSSHASRDSIPVLHNLGHIYYRAQNYKLAMTMYSRALEIARHPRNNDSQAAASSLNCMGVLFFHMSGSSDENASKALEMLAASLEVRKSMSLSDDVASAKVLRRDIATTMNNVGRVHYMLGDHSAALETYVEAYALRKELLPSDHLDLAASAYNLGQTHHQLGNLDDAMKLYTEFYNIVSKYLGSFHRDVAIILKCMAQVHHDRSEYEDAAKLYYRSLETTKAALGDLHPEVASTLNKIGNMYYENSDFTKAIKLYEEGLAVERAVLHMDHQNIAVTLTNIAQSYKHLGIHDKALERYAEAYNLQTTLLGPNHPKVALTLSNVAQARCRLGQYAPALEAYQTVLQIRRDAYGDNHIDVAATLNSIGLVLFRQGDHGLAVESFRESLRVRKLCLGEQHRDVAVVLYNIATTHLEQGDEDEAMACYAETLRVERATLGNDHLDLVVTLQHVGQVFRQRGELDMALEYFEEVLRIERLNRGNDSPSVARLLNRMGNIYLQKADIPKMMECFAEATRIFDASPSSSVDDGEEVEGNGELKITGYNFYSLSIFHPECAAAA